MDSDAKYPALEDVSLIYYFEHGIVSKGFVTTKETHMLLHDGTIECAYDMSYTKYQQYQAASKRLFIKNHVVKAFKRRCIAKYLPDISDVSSVRHYLKYNPNCSTCVRTYFHLHDGTILFILGMAIEEYITYWDKIDYYFRDQLRIKYFMIANYVRKIDAQRKLEWTNPKKQKISEEDKEDKLDNDHHMIMRDEGLHKVDLYHPFHNETDKVTFVNGETLSINNKAAAAAVSDQTIIVNNQGDLDYYQTYPVYNRAAVVSNQDDPNFHQTYPIYNKTNEAMSHGTFFIIKEPIGETKFVTAEVKSIDEFCNWCKSVHGCNTIYSSIEELKGEIKGVYIVRGNRGILKLYAKLFTTYDEWIRCYNPCRPFIEEICTYELIRNKLF